MTHAHAEVVRDLAGGTVEGGCPQWHRTYALRPGRSESRTASGESGPLGSSVARSSRQGILLGTLRESIRLRPRCTTSACRHADVTKARPSLGACHHKALLRCPGPERRTQTMDPRSDPTVGYAAVVDLS